MKPPIFRLSRGRTIANIGTLCCPDEGSSYRSQRRFSQETDDRPSSQFLLPADQAIAMLQAKISVAFLPHALGAHFRQERSTVAGQSPCVKLR